MKVQQRKFRARDYHTIAEGDRFKLVTSQGEYVLEETCDGFTVIYTGEREMHFKSGTANSLHILGDR